MTCRGIVQALGAASLVLITVLPSVASAQEVPQKGPTPISESLPEIGPPTPVYPGIAIEAPAPQLPAAHSEPPLSPSADAFGMSAGGLGNLTNPAFGHLTARADYRAAWFPSEAVQGQGTNLGYTQQDASLIVPLYVGATDEWSVSAHVRAEIFTTDAILPTTMQPFPDELWNVRFATTYRHLFDNGWIAGGSVSVGSASDKPPSTAFMRSRRA